MSEEYARLHNKHETSFSKLYFHEKNINYLQSELYNRLLEEGYKTKKQNEFLIQSYMYNIYEVYANPYNSNVSKEIQDLNERVLYKMTQVMLTEIKQYIGYIKDASQLAVPLEQPKHVSTKKSIQYNSF